MSLFRVQSFVSAAVVASLMIVMSSPRTTQAVVYQEAGGVVVGEAEHFSSRVSSANDTWTIRPTENAGTGIADGGPLVSVARGGAYIQTLADDLTGSGPNLPPTVSYKVKINNPGTYQLYLRWDGNNTNGTTAGQSDSMFADIVELKDGGGGAIADWYEFSDSITGNFNTFDPPSTSAWDAGAGFEQNVAGPANNPATWNIAAPGEYTLRFSQREDGSAVDAWALQDSSLPAPAGFGPLVSMTQQGQATALQAEADTYVRLGGGQNDNHFGSDSQLFIKDSGGGSTTRKVYLKYKLDDLNIRDIIDAQLSLEVSTNNNGGSPVDPTPAEYTINVYGLVDGVNDDWIETTSQDGVTGATPPNPLVWDNAPGNNTANNGVVGAVTELLGQFVVPALNPTQEGTPILVSFSNFQSASQDSFIDFLNADSDGLVTLILTRDGGVNNLGFASKENGSLMAPTLTVVQAVPEPTSALLILLGAGAVAGRRRREMAK